MKKLRVFGLMLVLAFTTAILSAKAPTDFPQRIHLVVKNRAAADEVARMISLDEATRGPNLYAWANGAEREKLEELGYSWEFAPEAARSPEAVTTCVGPSPFVPPASWNCYPSYQQYLDLMNYYATTYPSLCQLVDLGPSGNGQHELLALKISDNVGTEEEEPEFFYTATMHGDETAGYVLTLHLADELLTKYSSDTEIAALVNNLVIWINPLANPDGTFYGSDNSVSGSQRYLANGHDPNRSFPDPSNGDDPDSGSWDAEIQEMMDLAESESFVMSANFHGGAEVVNYPWDEWSSLHPDDAWFQTASLAYASNALADSPSGYMTGISSTGITNGYAWYYAGGTRQDYMNYYRGCREVTIELSNTKTLDSTQLEAHWGYNRQAMLDFMKEAEKGIHGLVTDSISGDPVAATIKVVGHDSETYKTFAYTDPDVGDYYRPIEAGTWDLEFSAEGYESKTVNGIIVSEGATIRQDVQLDALPSHSISGTVTDADTGLTIVGATVRLSDTGLAATQTSASGVFNFASVYDGTHTLSVSASGYGAKSESISVGASSTVFDVVLSPISSILDEDFETADGGFTATGAGGWAWGTDSTAGAASGSKVWGTVLNSDYSDYADWTLDSPSIAIPAGVDTAELVYQQWYEIENGYDGGQLQISIDGGAFTRLDPDGGYPDNTITGLGDTPGFTGTGGTSWAEIRADLSGAIGHNVVIRWWFGSDSSEYYRGWYLDDVQVLTSGGAPPASIFSDGFENGNADSWSFVSQ